MESFNWNIVSIFKNYNNMELFLYIVSFIQIRVLKLIKVALLSYLRSTGRSLLILHYLISAYFLTGYNFHLEWDMKYKLKWYKYIKIINNVALDHSRSYTIIKLLALSQPWGNAVCIVTSSIMQNNLDMFILYALVTV